MILNTIGQTIPNMIIENIEGVSIILTKEIDEEEIIFYINDLFDNIGDTSLINIIVFGNKEYSKEIANLNNISFENINDIESDCDSFAFISLKDNDFYMIGLNKKDFIKYQESYAQESGVEEFKSLY